jgi:hypothetical protein
MVGGEWVSGAGEILGVGVGVTRRRLLGWLAASPLVALVPWWKQHKIPEGWARDYSQPNGDLWTYPYTIHKWVRPDDRLYYEELGWEIVKWGEIPNQSVGFEIGAVTEQGSYNYMKLQITHQFQDILPVRHLGRFLRDRA